MQQSLNGPHGFVMMSKNSIDTRQKILVQRPDANNRAVPLNRHTRIFHKTVAGKYILGNFVVCFCVNYRMDFECESISYGDEEGESKSFRSHRWTSRLALQRAKNLKELFLETEPEWRLYENLKVAGIKFDIKPGTPKEQDPDDPSGRAKFVINNYAIQYRGAAGYLLKMSFGEDRYFSQVKDVVEGVKKRLG